MEWYPCDECSFNHPWPTGEKACPNRGMTREEVLLTVNRIASKEAVDITKAPLDERKRIQARERMRRMRERKKDNAISNP